MNDSEPQRPRVILPSDQFSSGDVLLPSAGEYASRTESGLLARVRQALRGGTTTTEHGLEVPVSMEQLSRRQSSQGLQTVTLPDIELYGNVQEPPEKKGKRSQTDKINALHNLKKFLVNEISKKHEGSPQIKQVQEVFAHVRDEKNTHYSPQVIERQIQEQEYFDKNTGVRETRAFSSPGTLEQVAIEMVMLLQEPEFQTGFSEDITKIVKKLLNNYRIGLDVGFQLPEMPDLVESVVHILDTGVFSVRDRFRLYDILEQITISPDQTNDVLALLDKWQDLDHPVAYQLTLDVANRDIHHGWIEFQQARREQLLIRLDEDPQSLFDQYHALMKASRDLVSVDNYIDPLSGQIGLEFEYGLKQKRPDESHLDRGAWANETRSSDGEMRRADHAWEYDLEYRKSLVEISQWLVDEASHPNSIHIHLDRVRHQFSPDLGQLYKEAAYDDTLKENPHGTWEFRGFVIPQIVNRLSPAGVANLIHLLIEASASPAQSPLEQKKITARGGEELDQLIFGHLVSHIPSPEGRLAALMSLHTLFAMRGINPLSLLKSYDVDSVPTIVSAAKKAKIDQSKRGIYLDIMEIAFTSQLAPELFQATLQNGTSQAGIEGWLGDAMNDPWQFKTALFKKFQEVALKPSFDASKMFTLFLSDQDAGVRFKTREFYAQGHLMIQYPGILTQLAISGRLEDQRFIKRLLRGPLADVGLSILMGEGSHYQVVDYINNRLIVEQAGTWMYLDKNPLSQEKIDAYVEYKAEQERLKQRAKEVFGNDFIDADAYRRIEQRLRQSGIEVEFDTDEIAFRHTWEDLDKAEQEKGTEQERFFILRPDMMRVKKQKVWVEQPVTVNTLKELFQNGNPFDSGDLIYPYSWFEDEPFADEPVLAGYGMPTKKVLPESCNKTWSEQDALLRQLGEKRRTAGEGVLDTLFHYARTGERLLPDKYDWLISRSSGGNRVSIGLFYADGLKVRDYHSGNRNSHLGVCPSR